MTSPCRYTSLAQVIAHVLDGPEGSISKGSVTACCLAHAGAWSAERASADLQAHLAAYDDMAEISAAVTHLAALEEFETTVPGKARYKLKMVRQQASKFKHQSAVCAICTANRAMQRCPEQSIMRQHGTVAALHTIILLDVHC
jgi:hypothetical protein